MNLNSAPILFIFKAIRFFIGIIILVVLVGFVSPYIANVSQYSYLKPLIQLDQTIYTTVKSTIPTTIAGKDLTRLITIILLLMISNFISGLQDRIQKAKFKDQLSTFRRQATTKEQIDLIDKMEVSIDSNDKLEGKSRQELLKDFISLKKELEKSGRTLSFLAIDVVDSTGMKVGEDAEIVESDFNQYHDFILGKFKDHGYIKAAWTPDGVMSCFNTTEQAINAAKDILSSLGEFNKTKMMKKDFHLRCGINTGFVYYDLSTPLEEFSDRVIDIAGHMQKHAPIDSILIPQEIINPIKAPEVFEKNSHMVDGLEVCKWNSDQDETKL